MDRDSQIDSTYSMKVSSDSSELSESDQESSEEWFGARYEEVSSKKNSRLCINEQNLDEMDMKRIKTPPKPELTPFEEIYDDELK